MAKLNTNDRSASTDDAAGEASVSPMAPFLLALEELEHRHSDALRRLGKWAVSKKDPAQLKFAYAAGETNAFLHAVSVLRKSIKEATDHDKAGGRSSTPSG